MAVRITLDAGHGRLGNHSPWVDEYYEGTQMFLLQGFLREELERRGFEVLVTRAQIDDNPELAERGRMAGENGCALFLSLHSNAPGHKLDEQGNIWYDPSVTGTVVYYSLTRPENRVLADRLGETVSAIMGHSFRGSQFRRYSEEQPDVDYYGVIRNAAQSCCRRALLIEHGFHTHPEDARFLLDEGNLRRLAEAEAQVIAEELFAEGLFAEGLG